VRSFQLLSQIAPDLGSEQVFSVFVVAAVLNYVGNRVCREEQKLQTVAKRIGVTAFIVLFAIGFLGDGGGQFAVSRLIQAGLIAWSVTGLLLIVLPLFSGALSTLFFRPVTATWRRLSRFLVSNRQRKQETKRSAEVEAQRLRDAAEWERGRHERERQERHAAAQAQLQANHRQAELKRCETARFQVRLVYDRYVGRVSELMSREEFDRYLNGELADTHGAEIVEARAKQVEKMIRDLNRTANTGGDFDSVDEIRDTYEERRRDIEHSEYDAETKAALLAELAWEEDFAARDMRNP